MKYGFWFALSWTLASSASAETYYARLGENGTVEQVVVLHPEVGGEEAKGAEFLRNLLGGEWVQTFQDGRRKNYAGIGDKFDRERNAFVPKKPFESWELDQETARWKAPTPRPLDGKRWLWNERKKNWIEDVKE